MAGIPFIPCLNIAQVNMQYQIPDGDVAENVFYVRDTATWNATKLAALLQTFFTWEATLTGGTSPKSSRSAACSCIAAEARDLTTQFGPIALATPTGGPIVGTDAANPLPNGMSLAIKGSAGLAGRSFRGRSFWIGLTIAFQAADKNAVTSTGGANLVTCLMNLRAAIKTAVATQDLGILSRFTTIGGIPDSPRPAGVFTPTTTYGLTDNYLDFQRRRAPAHSRHF